MNTFTRFFYVAAIAGACLLSYTAQAQTAVEKESVMQASAVARATYAANPSLQAARAALRGVQELYPQARANWHPDIDLGASVVTSDIDNSNFGAADGATTKDLTVSLQQPLWRGGRSVAQKSEAKRRIAAQYAALRAAEQRVLSASVLSGLEVVYSRKTLALQIENEDVYRNLLSAVERRRAAGETTDTEVYLANTRLARAMADRLSAQTALDNAVTRFEEIAGYLPEPWEEAVLPSLSFPSSGADALEVARRDNPDIIQAAFLTDAEKYNIKRVRGELYPEVSLTASWNRQWDPQPGIIDDSEVSQVGIEASMPLYEGGAVRSRIRQAKNAMIEKEYNARNVRLQIERAVINDWRLMVSAQEKKSLHRAEAEAAQAAMQNLEKEVFSGEKTLTDLLQAGQDWLDARASLLSVSHEAQAATIRLAAHLGLLTPENMGFADEAYEARDYLKRVRNRVLSESID